MTQNQHWLRIGAAAAFVLMVTMNALANILPINGVTSGQVSDSYPNLFAPAGFTFGVWSVIYILLGLYVLWQLGFLGGRRSHVPASAIGELSPYFIASSLMNAVWIVAWHYQFVLVALVLIVGMLVSLGRITGILYANRSEMSKRERLLVSLPFSVYFGWLSVATIANVTTWLVSIGWGGWGLSDELWMVVILVVGTAIGVLTTHRRRDVAYGLVFVWAYVGILAKHISPDGWAGQFPFAIITVSVLIGALSTVCVYTLVFVRKAELGWLRTLLQKK